MKSAVFHRNLKKNYIKMVSGDGVYLYDDNGKKYLDAVGGATVVVIGHGVKDITEAIALHSNEVSFVYSGFFTNQWQEELAKRILELAPDNMEGVYFVSGGSEANETAIKMALEYHIQKGNHSKHKIISRWLSYHGCTVGTLSLSGRTSWRKPFTPYLFNVPHIAPPYCYRCPFDHTYPQCNVSCAYDLERTILLEGPDTVSAFIAEPIIGTTVTGVTPVAEYYSIIREICDKYDVLFIVDEVLVGYGRTGNVFAIDKWKVKPDIITIGKAISSGYTPLAAVVASDKVMEAFRQGNGLFTHGFTYSGNPMSCFIGVNVLEYIMKHNLFERAAEMGAYLHQKLRHLADKHSIIGDVRGQGLLAGLEFVKDKETKEPYPTELQIAEKITTLALNEGVIFIPGVKGANYGKNGDHIQISPPYIITREQIDDLVNVLNKVLMEVQEQI